MMLASVTMMNLDKKVNECLSGSKIKMRRDYMDERGCSFLVVGFEQVYEIVVPNDEKTVFVYRIRDDYKENLVEFAFKNLSDVFVFVTLILSKYMQKGGKPFSVSVIGTKKIWGINYKELWPEENMFAIMSANVLKVAMEYELFVVLNATLSKNKSILVNKESIPKKKRRFCFSEDKWEKDNVLLSELKSEE